MNNKRFKRPIQRVVITGSILFVIILCAVIILASHSVLQSALSDRYEEKFREILNYTESMIDVDDLKECIRTKQPSDKYIELQDQFDSMLDEFELDHFYCIIASNTQIWNVVTAVSKEDLDAGRTHLGINEAYVFFPSSELQRYMSFWKNDDISYFEELTWSGLFYTAAKPVKDSDGKTVALLCLDVSVTTISDLLERFILPIIIGLIVICAIFLVMLILWLRSQVIRPVVQLEESVRNYADKSHMLRDIDDLTLEIPDIHTRNEVESLAHAIQKMSVDMRDYVRAILNAETRAESAEREAKDMTTIAYRDALTSVKSKAAYDIKEAELEDKIRKGTAEFGLVMVDLNNLKLVNDNFGHDKGDEYIIGACRQICDSFPHSPVYRIGGDEFLVVLEGDDYIGRDERFRDLNETFEASRADEQRPLWHCYSAAGGMAVYDREKDLSVEDVRRSADVAMYADKQHMKSLTAKGEMTDRCSGLKGGR